MNKKTNSQTMMTYEPEADVLSWEITEEPIDYAKEIGDLIVHFTKKHTPVLIEILEAKKFLQNSRQLIEQKHHTLVRQRIAA